MHTSASLTINENWDSDVRSDMEKSLNRLVPESNELYDHNCEGSDDMPAHVKSSILGCSVQIPVSSGKLCLGTWQGLWLCEHRNQSHRRNIMITIHGLRNL